MLTYHNTLKRANSASQFGDLPIVFFKARSKMSEGKRAHHRKQGIDPEQRAAAGLAMVNDFVSRSSNSQLVYIDGNHNSIYTDPDNAAIICKGIKQLVRDLRLSSKN